MQHQVNTTHGCVRGEHVSKNVNGVVYSYFAFRGIPYATPPLGELRFKVTLFFLYYLFNFKNSRSSSKII